MTLYEIFHTVPWSAVEIALKDHYDITPKSLEGHHVIFDRCLVLEPVTVKMILRIRTHIEDGEDYIDIVGTDGTKCKDLPDYRESTEEQIESMKKLGLTPTKADDLVEYALEFQPWQEWLGMTIEPETLLKFSPEEIIACSLWEMTFIGFEESKIQGEKTRLDGMVEDIKAGRGIGKSYDNVEEFINDLMGDVNVKEENGEED
jgi:hypothetical protein